MTREIIKDEELNFKEIHVDSTDLVGCLVKNCSLVYSANGPVHLERNIFVDAVWTIQGNASQALKMFNFFISMGLMYFEDNQLKIKEVVTHD